MPITIYPPNTAPVLPSTYPDSPQNYPSSASYADWIGSGGSSGLGPDPSWYLAVADLPATVEARNDDAHHVNELVFTAVGGETSVTFTLEAPLTLSSGYLSLQPIVSSADAASYQFGSENGGQIVPSLSGPMSVSGGVFTARLNGGGTWLANGHYFTFGAMPDAPQLEGLKILITSTTNTTGSTMTATFVGSTPADFSITATHINYIVPANGTYNLTSFNLYPFNQGDGTVDYLTGVVTLPCSALPAGTKIYATYGTRLKNMGDFQIPWTNLSALASGSGPATCTLTPMTYNANYGSPLFNDSQWLVCRNFGFNLPSNAVIKHVGFAFEGGTIASFSGEAGIQNLALLVGNQFQLPPYTQCDGDLGDQYYVGQGVGSNDYWGFLDLNWPGSTANDGSSEFTGSDLWDYDYFGIKMTDPVSGIGFAPTGLTVADVNDPGFGFGISGNYGDSTGSANITVKSVRVMVWYEAAASNVDADTSTVTASPAEVLANRITTSTITVTLLDSQGDPVAGQTVTLAGTGSSTISAPSGPSDSNGVVTFSVTDAKVELCVYTATAGSVTITQTASVQFVEAGHVNGTVYGQQGPAVAGSSVYALEQPADLSNLTPLLPIFADADAQESISQPISTDGLGAFDFFAPPSLFTLVVVNGSTQQTYADQEIGKPSAAYHCLDWWVKSNQGPAVPGAQVFVVQNDYPHLPATLAQGQPNPQLQLFSDPNGLFPLSQPLLTDGFGHCNAYAPAGVYTIAVYLNGSLQQTYPDQSVGGIYAGPMARRDLWVRNALGVAQTNARVIVSTQPCSIPGALVPQFPTSLANIYADAAGNVPLQQSLTYDANGNPVIQSLTTDALGHCAFYSLPNVLLTISVYSSSGILLYQLPDQAL